MNATTRETDYSTVPLSALTGQQRSALIGLHTTLLPNSPVVLLGPRFLDFYYRYLVDDELIKGSLALVGGVPAGFIVATHDSEGFMAKGIKRHFFRLAMTLALAVVLSPSRLAGIWEALQIMRNLDTSPAGENTGELLSLGVLPAFRSRKFVKETGLNISVDLVKSSVTTLTTMNVSRIRSVVDQDNTEARMFYLGLGWKPGPAVGGWRVPSVEFTLDI